MPQKRGKPTLFRGFGASETAEAVSTAYGAAAEETKNYVVYNDTPTTTLTFSLKNGVVTAIEYAVESQPLSTAFFVAFLPRVCYNRQKGTAFTKGRETMKKITSLFLSAVMLICLLGGGIGLLLSGVELQGFKLVGHGNAFFHRR